MLYLRARYYNPADGRFQSRDTWGGDYNNPLSLNRWGYVEGNPVNFVDSSGNIPCDDEDSACISERAQRLKFTGESIKYAVRNGYLLPVEGFAQLADLALPLCDYDIKQAMWGLTMVIDGFNPNSSKSVWYQGWKGIHDTTYWLGYDWLPYQNDPSNDVLNWGENGEVWIHSRQGDWRKDYWDKTANQAYHFWFAVAVTFYDSQAWAHLANIIHDSPVYWVDIDSLGDKDAPPSAGYTQQDWNLSLAGMRLGMKIYLDSRFIERGIGYCPSDEQLHDLYYAHTTKIGTWIRANLK